MSNVVRWDPFSDLRVTMDRLLDDTWTRPRRRMLSARDFAAIVPVEVSETDSAVEVKASLPGVAPDEVEVTVHDDVLTIKAEHRETKSEGEAPAEGEGETKPESGKRQFYRREIRYGAFHRSLHLPASVDSDRAEARFENGVLHLTLPKAAADQPRRIKISSAAES